MRSFSRHLAGLAALALLGAGPLAAQHPQVRKGFWIAFGPGYGSSHFSCDGCAGDTKSDLTFDLRMGGTLKPNLLLGGDITGWTHAESGTTMNFGTVAFAAWYYPMTDGGLFLKGGAGFSTLQLKNGGQTADGTGAGFVVGAGYDIRVGRNISITPVVNFQYGMVGDIKYNSTTIGTGWKQTLFAGGLNVTFH